MLSRIRRDNLVTRAVYLNALNIEWSTIVNFMHITCNSIIVIIIIIILMLLGKFHRVVSRKLVYE